MPTPLPSGTISLADVDVYLGAPATQLISLNDTPVRTLAGVPSGTIAMSNLQGKPGNPFIYNITTNTANLDLRPTLISAGWNGTDPVTVNIANGVVIYSGSTGSYAMTVTGDFPAGLTINNNGYIVGMGGVGGGGTYSAGVPGSAGGPALFVGTVFNLNNQGTIASGGGGGGASYGYTQTAKGFTQGDTGGGGGGGQSSLAPASGGIPIPPTLPVLRRNGAPGASGTFAARGAGGVGNGNETATGGPGGVWGSAGAQGANFISYPAGAPGGAAGTAITGNGLINYTNPGTVLGPVTNGDETLLTISSPVTSGYNISTEAFAAGWNGSRRVRIVINPGVSVVSASTGTASMTSASTAYPNGLYIFNNGYIVGRGGTGGNGMSRSPGAPANPGGSGGIGLSISPTAGTPVYMINNGTIGGGGGGGGAGNWGYYGPTGGSGLWSGGGGGGAGFGVGGTASPTNGGSPGTVTLGGTAGTPQASGPGYGGYSAPGGALASSGGAGGRGYYLIYFKGGYSQGPTSGTLSVGGSGGWAVYGDNLITYVTTGTIVGSRQSSVANLTVSTPQVNYNLRTVALAAGWNGVATVNLTINPGVTISSSSAGTPALTISGAFPNGASLVNNGTISGAGGSGGGGAGWYDGGKAGILGASGSPGVGGGTALYVTVASTPVTNNGTIAGGGGGGGGASSDAYPVPYGKATQVAYIGGPGGGGGAGNSGGPGGGGGQGGAAIGVAGGGPSGSTGNTGGATTGGAGINGGGPLISGAGGARGSSGSDGAGYPGGAAGASVVGTANITWLATGTRIGPIS